MDQGGSMQGTVKLAQTEATTLPMEFKVEIDVRLNSGYYSGLLEHRQSR